MIQCNLLTKTSLIEASKAIGQKLHLQANVRVVWEDKTIRTILRLRVAVKKGFQIQLVVLMRSGEISVIQMLGICPSYSLVSYAPRFSASPYGKHVSI